MSFFRISGAIAAACLGLVAASPLRAQDPGWKGVITVGAGDNCTARTMASAIDVRRTDPGYLPIIWVSNDFHRDFFDGGTITLDNISVEIIGGFDDCNDITPSGYTRISGQGGSSNSVFTISGHSRVWMAHLEITEGDDGPNDDGGGIDFKGTGELNLEHIRLMNNRAGYGGGLLVHGDQGNFTNPLRVNVGDDVVIGDNVADHDGGGIHISGLAVLATTGRNVALHRNKALGINQGADGQGGGLYLQAKAVADIRAAAFPGYPVFWRNEARYGGGIVVTGGSTNERAIVRLSTLSDDAEPITLSENRASVAGGAVYLGATSSSNNAMCATDTTFRDNVAPEGAAVYASVTGGNQSRFVTNGADVVECGGSLYRCPGGRRCSAFQGNRTEQSNGTPTDGSIIEFPGGGDGELTLHRTRLTGNTAGRLIHVGDNGGNLFQIDNSLLARNDVRRPLIDTDANESHLRHLTIVDNRIFAPHVLRLVESDDNRTVSLSTITNSIIAQPGRFSLDHVGPKEQTTIKYVLANDTTTLPNDPTVFVGNPSFDTIADDYIPTGNSVVVDYAPQNIPGEENDGFALDLLGNPRTQDLPPEHGQDPLRTRDLGCYELQQAPSERAFQDGFE